MRRTDSPLQVFAVLAAAGAALTTTFESSEPERTAADMTLEWFDADRDGRVEPFEAAAVAMQFVDWYDEDESGTLEPAELEELCERFASEEYEETDDLLRKYDEDRDDRLMRGEVPTSEHELFTFADVNGDEALSREELNDAFEQWAEEEDVDVEEVADGYIEDYDGDDDARIAWSEVDEDDEFRDDFSFVDRDGDRFLTRGELVRYLTIDLGSATFEVNGDVAVVMGTLDSTTPGRVLRLIVEHPEVKTLELRWIGGSTDDEANLWAARWVRRRGLSTHVPEGGMVASGGTDFLLAGVRRTVAPGGRVGVHSWDAGSVEGGALPRDHEDHELYLSLCREMGVPEEYYWFTIEAAPADGMHWATREELVKYGMVTE